MSAACAIGTGLGEIRRALRDGRSGLAPADFGTPFDTVCGVLPVEPPALRGDLAPFDCRQGRLAHAVACDLAPAVEAACARWGAERVGVAVGTSTGVVQVAVARLDASGVDRIVCDVLDAATEAALATWADSGRLPATYDLARQHAMDATLALVRARTGARGPGLVVSTACSSSGKVFATARRWLTMGLVDAVVVGGVDTLCELTLRGFHALEVLSPRRCRPFSAERAGINLGEAGALLLVERAGDGPIRLLGVGESSDAHHMSAPHPEGAGAHAAMAAALTDAGLTPPDVDHVNAHATGTRLNDAAESRAIAELLGAAVPVVGTKALTGHTLGAAGALEAVLTAMCLEAGALPATAGADPVDPTLAIDVVTRARAVPGRVALSNSFAFGGSNVCVALGGPA